jgi:anti-sigma-K factor RskA
MNCELASQLTGAYALDALTSEERLALESHLATCPNHEQELAGFRRVAQALAGSAEPLAPPQGLRARILAAVEEPPATRTSGGLAQIRQAPPPRPARLFGLPHTLAAVFALVALGLLVWNITLLADDGRPPGTVETYAFSGPGGSGEVIFVPHDNLVVVRLAGLANLPAGRDYQVWAIEGGTPRSLGLLTVERGIAVLAAIGVDRQIDAVAITVEPAGGSPEPTTDPVLIATTA